MVISRITLIKKGTLKSFIDIHVNQSKSQNLFMSQSHLLTPSHTQWDNNQFLGTPCANLSASLSAYLLLQTPAAPCSVCTDFSSFNSSFQADGIFILLATHHPAVSGLKFIPLCSETLSIKLHRFFTKLYGNFLFTWWHMSDLNLLRYQLIVLCIRMFPTY